MQRPNSVRKSSGTIGRRHEDDCDICTTTSTSRLKYPAGSELTEVSKALTVSGVHMAGTQHEDLAEKENGNHGFNGQGEIAKKQIWINQEKNNIFRQEQLQEKPAEEEKPECINIAVSVNPNKNVRKIVVKVTDINDNESVSSADTTDSWSVGKKKPGHRYKFTSQHLRQSRRPTSAPPEHYIGRPYSYDLKRHDRFLRQITLCLRSQKLQPRTLSGLNRRSVNSSTASYRSQEEQVQTLPGKSQTVCTSISQQSTAPQVKSQEDQVPLLPGKSGITSTAISQQSTVPQVKFQEIPVQSLPGKSYVADSISQQSITLQVKSQEEQVQPLPGKPHIACITISQQSAAPHVTFQDEPVQSLPRKSNIADSNSHQSAVPQVKSQEEQVQSLPGKSRIACTTISQQYFEQVLPKLSNQNRHAKIQYQKKFSGAKKSDYLAFREYAKTPCNMNEMSFNVNGTAMLVINGSQSTWSKPK